MLHESRVHDVVDVASLRELADLLTSRVWSLAAGFRLSEVVLLNDSTAPDAVQEFAVLVGGQQVESITVDGLNAASALAVICSTLGWIAEPSIAGRATCGRSSRRR